MRLARFWRFTLPGGNRPRVICPVCSRAVAIKPEKLTVGRETTKCVCGAIVSTGKREWVHTSDLERRSFWNLRSVIPVLLTSFLVSGFVFGTWDRYASGQAGLAFDWRSSFWGSIACGVLFMFDFGLRLLQVRLSLRRLPDASRK